MYKDPNPDHWKLLIFYYNPDYPSLFVAKRYGGYLTLNFARPLAWAFVAVPIAVILIAALVFKAPSGL